METGHNCPAHASWQARLLELSSDHGYDQEKDPPRKPPRGGPVRRPRPKTAAGPREKRLPSEALKMVDKAAPCCRHSSGAQTTQKTRLEAKHQAHGLLNKASLPSSTTSSARVHSTLHNVINKI